MMIPDLFTYLVIHFPARHLWREKSRERRCRDADHDVKGAGRSRARQPDQTAPAGLSLRTLDVMSRRGGMVSGAPAGRRSVGVRPRLAQAYPLTRDPGRHLAAGAIPAYYSTPDASHTAEGSRGVKSKTEVTRLPANHVPGKMRLLSVTDRDPEGSPATMRKRRNSKSDRDALKFGSDACHPTTTT